MISPRDSEATLNPGRDESDVEKASSPLGMHHAENDGNFDASEKQPEPGTEKDDGRDSEPTIVVFEQGDPENPQNWSTTKKASVTLLSIVLTLNSTLSSSISSGSISAVAAYFGVTDENQLVLPISVFLIGYILGPLFLAPLSEIYGRRPVLLYSFVVFDLFSLGTAVVNDFPGLLVLRFLTGTAASAPLAIVGAVYADCFPNAIHRGRIMALFGAGTTLGPTLSPVISGFLGQVSWRWPFWFTVIFGGITLVPVIFWPESFPPIILAKRAARMRKEQGRDDIVAADDPANIDKWELFSVTLVRPVTMCFTEPIVSAVSLYMAFLYAVLYMFFQAYPIIFKEMYEFPPGIDGLPYLPIGIGSALCAAVVVWWDGQIRKKQAQNPEYIVTSEYHRLTLASLGGPLIVGSLFWLGWTARLSIHWIVPILAGLPFGLGCAMIFMALMNYLGDAYGIYSASALATAACTRSISGTLLPMAARPMYRDLGIAWANSVLGFIMLTMAVIPFVFIRYGQRIRAGSPFCQQVLHKKDGGGG